MPLKKLQFNPGVNQEVTSYSNEGGWRDCDKIRFRFGYPEKIGGWEKYTSATYLGSARALHNWIALDGSNYLGVGTHLKYYIEEGELYNDITPVRSTTAAGDVTFAATTTSPFSSIITVTDTGHGAQQNDFVTFSGATALGGNVTAALLNDEHQITRVIDGDTYEITLSVLSNASDTANGGSACVGTYQINVGLDTTVGGTGWGAGLYGGVVTGAAQTTLNEGGTLSATDTTVTLTTSSPNSHQIVANDVILVDNELMFVTAVSGNDLTVVRGYAGSGASTNVNTQAYLTSISSNGSPQNVTHADGSTVILAVGNANAADDYFGWGQANSGGLSTTTNIRLWSHDNFGEDLLINPRDSGIFYWDKTNNLSSAAVSLNTVSGTKTSIPTLCKQVLVSDRDRHVIAFGADGLGASASAVNGNGVQDPLLIRFSNQESATEWYPTATNTAGDLRLGSGSEFVQAVETKREILIWTDTSLTSMRFIGPPFTFGLQQLASNITIMSSNAAVATEDVVFWMGIDNFYIYAGQTQQLPCTVKGKVFLDFNLEERDKVTSGVNSEFGEVTWFYPSAGATENNRYVTYNYVEKVWYFGTIERTAWHDRGSRPFPIGAGGGYIYNHELGYDDDGSAMTAFIESAAIDLDDGDRYVCVTKIIPDLTFDGSTALSSPQATFTIKSRNNPGADFSSTSSGVTTRTQSVPVEKFTERLNVRSRGRSFALRLESNSLGSKWKLGSPRVDIRADGRR